MEFENIPQAGLSSFSGYGPILSGLTGTATNTFPGGDSNPLNYPLSAIELGNGLGFASEKPGLGFPHDGFAGKRFGIYGADFWKVKPNLTLTLALRYNHISGRTDSDACGLPILESLVPGSSHAPRQPNLNFAPQVGVAWDPFRDGKTSVRMGAGFFYHNFLAENLSFDRSLRIPAGLANSTPVLTTGLVPGINLDITHLIGQPIGNVVDQVVAAQAAYRAANAQAAQNFNPKGTPGFEDPNVINFNTQYGLLAPNLKLPRSVTFNIGIQRNLKGSLFVSVDYIRSVNTHSLLNHDVNYVGAANTFDATAAQGAINATLQACGATNIDAAINDYSQLYPGGATISDTIGRSVYNALQVRFKQDVAHPFRGVRQLTWAANYNLSRNRSTAPDQDVVYNQNAHDNFSPLHYFGPNALDRTHMFSFVSTFDFVGGLRLTMLTRVNSALSNTLTIPLGCGCPAEIFYSDLTGDGTGGDVLPGANVGTFGRSVKVGSLNHTIAGFNNKYEGGFTPAGQALVSSGLMTATQLQQLGGVVQHIALAPTGLQRRQQGELRSAGGLHHLACSRSAGRIVFLARWRSACA
jgi:hypothetical protein